MHITLDHNCIIELEKNTTNAEYIRALIAMHNPPKITVTASAIGASERLSKLLGGGYISHFSRFEERVALLELSKYEMPKPVGYYDMTFYGQSLYSGETTEKLEQAIHYILFPEIEFSYEAFCRKRDLPFPETGDLNKTWRNAKCDVLALWSHINEKGTIFTTMDKNFHKATKKPSLIALGAGDILYPKEALEKAKSFT